MQLMPNGDPKGIDLALRFEEAVYEAVASVNKTGA